MAPTYDDSLASGFDLVRHTFVDAGCVDQRKWRIYVMFCQLQFPPGGQQDDADLGPYTNFAVEGLRRLIAKQGQCILRSS
jgi:hypothetical protein